jgi:ABC-type phosphate transport system permease subunit
LLGIILSLVFGAIPSMREFGFSFLWTAEWDPVRERFGGLVMIYGTLVTSVIALLIAVPVSFGIAIFLTELSPGWLRRPLGTAIELLAAIPSIVYGMWGLLVFAPIFSSYVQVPLQNVFGGIPGIGALFQGPPIGIGILCASIILAIMIIPFIASVMRDGLRPGRDHLGSGVAGRASLHQDRRHRRHHAGSGARTRRDHGDHVRHRQREPAQQHFAVRRRQQHHLCAGQRILRGQPGQPA